MSETITARVLDALANAGLLTDEQIGSVTEAADAAGLTPGDVLLQRGMVTTGDIESTLEEELGIPRVDLRSYAPDDDALQLVPVAVARERNVLPLFEIENMLTMAIADPMDVFKLDELSSVIGLEIEAVLSDAPSIDEAILQYYGAAEEPAPESGSELEPLAEEPQPGGFDLAPELEEGVPATEPEPAADYEQLSDGPPPAPTSEFTDELTPFEEPTEELPQIGDEFDSQDLFDAPTEEETPIVAEPVLADDELEIHAEEITTLEDVVVLRREGPAAIDLDVLAVADAHKIALLVTEILELAAERGASRVHLLPYKDDFFLVFRIQGRLEQIASAPISLQGALVEAFKNYAHLGTVKSSLPALGRLKATLGDRELVVTVSAVPTIAGQRVVISLAPEKARLRALDELGMNEAESRALRAMVERGRGILLLCAPVAGGRSTTYYALLDYAAQIGKTVYSVERAVEHEIPAVAQVLVNPGEPVGAESYFAAGIRQDTDVMAIDAMQSVEDVHLAIEAAGKGKLVIASFTGGDIVTGVRRMLDLGAEPVSLAAALTLGVGQRLVRLNCPQCSLEQASDVANLIPGAEPGLMVKVGQGCPACGNTGFQGATGVFEVLPFTEQVRAPISRGASADEIAAAARAAGMRPMITSGLSKVTDGLVAPDELNRVLRFADR